MGLEIQFRCILFTLIILDVSTTWLESICLQDRIVLSHRSGEELPKRSAALMVPKNSVTSIILQLKKFGTAKTLPRAGQTEQGPWSGRWPRTRWPLWQSSRVPLWRWLSFWKVHPSLQHSTIQAFMSRVARRKPLLSKRHMTARLDFTKRHLKTLRPWETRFSGLMILRCNSLAWMPSVTSGGNLTSSLLWSMVVAASCCGDVFQRQGLGD